MGMSVKIFCCYAREDEAALKDLRKHLRSLEFQGLISTWYDGEISAGAEWEQEIRTHLEEAQIILLLVSSDFIASDYCYNKEMKQAMERHEQKKARVIPIMFRPVDCSGTPFSKLQALPKDALPITKWTHKDDAFLDIAQSIRKVVEELLQSPREKTDIPDNNMLTCQIAQESVRVTGGSQIDYVLLETKYVSPIAQVYQPFNIAFVIDNSGTTRGAKLKNIKQGVKDVIDRLGPDDFVSVITFNDRVHKVFPFTPAGDKNILQASIDRIVDGGSMDNFTMKMVNYFEVSRFMSSGILMGLNELERCREKAPNVISRMILITDGPTSGDAENCRQFAKDAAAAGIPIYPMGIGSDWDENLLDDIGHLSGGTPAEFIRSPSDLMGRLAELIQHPIAPTIQNAILLLRFPTGVYPRKVVKVLPNVYEIKQSIQHDRQITIMLENMELNTSQSILVELVIEPYKGNLRRIAQAEFSFDILLGAVRNEKAKKDIIVDFTSDISKTEKINENVMKHVKKIYGI
jgi:Ca-activated chloride channel homolog